MICSILSKPEVNQMEKREFMLSVYHLSEIRPAGGKGAAFRAVNPTSAAELEPVFYSATSEDIDRAATLAEAAFPALTGLSGRERAARRLSAVHDAWRFTRLNRVRQAPQGNIRRELSLTYKEALKRKK